MLRGRTAPVHHSRHAVPARRLSPCAAAPVNRGGFGGKSVAPATPVLPGYEGDGDEFFLLARSGSDGRWLPLGDVVLAPGGDVATALAQRHAELKKFALKRHVSLAARKPGVVLEIGYRLQKGRPAGDTAAGDVALVAETAAADAAPVAASLRLIEAESKPSTRQSLLAPRGSAAAPGGFTSRALK